MLTGSLHCLEVAYYQRIILHVGEHEMFVADLALFCELAGASVVSSADLRLVLRHGSLGHGAPIETAKFRGLPPCGLSPAAALDGHTSCRPQGLRPCGQQPSRTAVLQG